MRACFTLILIGFSVVVGCRSQGSLESADSVAPSDVSSSDSTASLGFDVPVPETFDLSSSLSVRFLKSSHVPLVSLRLLIPAGSIHDPKGKEGLASLATDMLDEGAGDRGALEIAEELEFLGASFSISTGKEYTSISLQVLRRNLDAALRILADVVAAPRFEEAEWQRVKSLAVNALRQRSERATTVAAVTGSRVFYGEGNAYAHPSSGYIASVTSIELEDVKSFWSRHASPSRSKLLVCGELTGDELRKILEARLEAWQSSGDESAASEESSAGAASDSAGGDSGRRLVVVEKPGAPQTVLQVYLPAPSYGGPGSARLSLSNTIFGGTFTSRLNSNLREDKKITYGARAQVAAPLFRSGHHVASTSVQSDATAMGLVELHREFQAMAAGNLRPGEIDKARSSTRSRLIEAMESQSSLLSIFARSAAGGKPVDERRAYYGRIAGATKEGVEATCRASYRWEDALIVVVGDRAKIDAALTRLTSESGRTELSAAPGFSLPSAEFHDREGARIAAP